MRCPLLLSVPLLLAGAAAFPAAAQVATGVARTDADRLADAVRRVGASPRDLSALVEAGELSIKVGDATAAAALFKRAEQVDPNNGRVKAGIARILVAGEHPGEALRYFDQAARTGLSMAPYAGDRGLAYDLTGEQARAQRDYRLALKQDDDDEIRRRYALSLGISGQRDAALKEIDALLRRSDRGAWRARAFILAMNGDVAGANKIAASMMPGMASGLSAFFQRLPALGATDRAFAVHFGEVAASPARLADARLAPPLGVLTADPDAPRPTQVAAATPVATAPVQIARADRDRRSRPNRDRDTRRSIAGSSDYAAPVVTGRPVATGGIAPVPAFGAVTTARPAVVPVPTTAPVVAAIVPAPAPRPATPPPASVVPAPVGVARTIVPAPAPQTPAVQTAAVRVPTPQVPVAQTRTAQPSAAQPSMTQPSATVPARVTPIPGIVPAVSTAALRPPATATATVTAAATPVAARAVTRPANAAPPPRGDADEILARIVAGITIPASELATPPVRAAATTGTLERVARRAERNVAIQRAAEKAPLRTVAATDEPPAKPTAAERRAKATADRKAREAAAEKKVLADKAAAEKKAMRADPPRYWVQVAGGANEGDLGRAWSAAQKKAPALAGKSAYTTPLRATNRIVTGPFKTEAEARAMVNTLSKQGMSAFTFASSAGQKMTRLGGK